MNKSNAKKIAETITFEKVEEMFEEWGKITHRIDTAYQTNVFNAVPNFGCRWCPFAICAHNGK